MSAIDILKLYAFKRKWRKHNHHNGTFPANIFDMNLVTVGKMTYGEIYVSSFSRNYYLRIGNYCSIGPEVLFLLSSDHRMDLPSTFPFSVKCFGENNEAISKGNIVIEDDVWIGARAIILSGIHIGQGAVIAAGAIVTHDVPPYAIVGGNPAKIIKNRFDDSIINELMKIDYSLLDNEMIKKDLKQWYTPVKCTTDLVWLDN